MQSDSAITYGTAKNRENFQMLCLNGHSVRYTSFGSGENVVFLHGWGASVSAFLFVARRLSENFRVTLFDFSGFGESDPPPKPYSVADYAQETLGILGHLGITRANFVGHSFGGRVAIELAAKFPQIVKSLVLIDSAGIKPRRGLKYYFKIYLHKLLVKSGRSGLKGSSDYRMLSPLMRETFKNVVNYHQNNLLPSIKCPSAIFWGKKDADTPMYMARKLKKGIRGSELFLLDGGHFAYIDDCNKFILILTAFLKEAEK